MKNIRLSLNKYVLIKSYKKNEQQLFKSSIKTITNEIILLLKQAESSKFHLLFTRNSIDRKTFTFIVCICFSA